MIEVIITTDETIHLRLGYRSWVSFVANILRDNGIPVIGNDDLYRLESGLLRRFDDPGDFGSCKYVWYEDGETKKPPEGG